MASQEVVQELVYKLVGDSSGLKGAMAEVDKTVDKTAKNTKKQFSDMARFLKTTIATLGVTAFYKEIIKEASDAQEANNKLRAVFSTMKDEAIAAAENLARFYGMSKTQAVDMLSATGNILTGFGLSQEVALQLSKQINELGTDLASFVNYAGGAAGAANALTRALLGEREAAKALGVAITENDIKNLASLYGLSTTGLTRQQRALLTMEVMLKQTKNAQGDFARSEKDLMNQTRILTAAFEDMKLVLGQQLIPTVTWAVGEMTNFLRIWEQLPDAVQTFLALSPAIALSLTLIGRAIAAIKMAGGIASFFTPWKVAAVAVGAVAVGVSVVATAISKAKAEARDLDGAIGDLKQASISYNDVLDKRNALLDLNKSDMSEVTKETLDYYNIQLDLITVEKELIVLNTNKTYKARVSEINELNDAYKQAIVTQKAYKALVDGTALSELEAFEKLGYKTLSADTQDYVDALREVVKWVNITGATEIEQKQATVDAYNDAVTAETAYVKAQKALNASVEEAARLFKDDEQALAEFAAVADSDLYDAVLASIEVINSAIASQSQYADLIVSSEYKTKDWVGALDDATKNIRKLGEEEDAEAGRYNKLLDSKLKGLKAEQKLYEEYATQYENFILEQYGHNKALAEESTDWQKVQQDRLNMTKYYEKEQVYWTKYYAKERLDSEKDYVDKLQGMWDELSTTRYGALEKSIRDMRKTLDEVGNLALASVGGLSDGMQSRLIQVADAVAQAGGDMTASQRRLYDNWNPDTQLAFDRLLEAYKAYYANVEDLTNAFNSSEAELVAEWNTKYLELTADTWVKRRDWLQAEWDKALDEVEDNAALEAAINQYYQEKMLSDRKYYYSDMVDNAQDWLDKVATLGMSELEISQYNMERELKLAKERTAKLVAEHDEQLANDVEVSQELLDALDAAGQAELAITRFYTDEQTRIIEEAANERNSVLTSWTDKIAALHEDEYQQLAREEAKYMVQYADDAEMRAVITKYYADRRVQIETDALKKIADETKSWTDKLWELNNQSEYDRALRAYEEYINGEEVMTEAWVAKGAYLWGVVVSEREKLKNAELELVTEWNEKIFNQEATDLEKINRMEAKDLETYKDNQAMRTLILQYYANERLAIEKRAQAERDEVNADWAEKLVLQSATELEKLNYEEKKYLSQYEDNEEAKLKISQYYAIERTKLEEETAKKMADAVAECNEKIWELTVKPTEYQKAVREYMTIRDTIIALGAEATDEMYKEQEYLWLKINDLLQTGVQQYMDTYNDFVKSITQRDTMDLAMLWMYDYPYMLSQLQDTMDKELKLVEGNEEKMLQVRKRYADLTRDLKTQAIMDSVQMGLDITSQVLSSISDIGDMFADNALDSAQALLTKYKDMRSQLESEASDSGRELTKAEKEELERRTALLEEQIEQQEQLVRQEKEKQFKQQQAYSIAEATISGLQAAINAYNSMSGIPVVGPALGAAAAAVAAAFVGAKIAAIASQTMPSYAQGAYNLPQDQVANVHAGEMIIPKPFADEIRDGNGFGGSEIVMNIYAVTSDTEVDTKTSEDGLTVDVVIGSTWQKLYSQGKFDQAMLMRHNLVKAGRKS